MANQRNKRLPDIDGTAMRLTPVCKPITGTSKLVVREVDSGYTAPTSRPPTSYDVSYSVAEELRRRSGRDSAYIPRETACAMLGWSAYQLRQAILAGTLRHGGGGSASWVALDDVERVIEQQLEEMDSTMLQEPLL